MCADQTRGGASAKLQYFLIISTCLLYLVAAGLFSRGVWYIQAQAWNKEVGSDADEVGSGPGSYDITKSVWHVNVRHPSSLPLSLPPPLYFNH
jgi:high-affinity iron transporter